VYCGTNTEHEDGSRADRTAPVCVVKLEFRGGGVMDVVKNFLFDILIIIGLIAMIVALMWLALKLLNRVFKFSELIIRYYKYKRNDELYDIRNKVIVAKDGKISYSCVGDIDEQIEILNKGIEYAMKIKDIRERLAENI
jgi:hypothetical protein